MFNNILVLLHQNGNWATGLHGCLVRYMATPNPFRGGTNTTYDLVDGWK
jgi:hypothetical protein